MSNLRELLNPEKPDKCLSESKADGLPIGHGLESLVEKASAPKATDRNPVSFHDPLCNADVQYNVHSCPSLADDKAGHPTHENCPDSLDCLPDTNDKPQHTLPVILRCAILGSAKRRLTIRDIYAAMEKKYPYYRTAGPAWKQSVRHHLSLNRLFERKAKPVTEPGFGSYWTVNLEAPPGTKRPRKRGRTNKGASRSNERNSPVITDTSPRSKAAKNYVLQDFEPNRSSKLPSRFSVQVPSHDYATLKMPSRWFPTHQLSTVSRLSQQYRIHDIHDLPSRSVEVYDDDEMLDIHNHVADNDSSPLSDDMGDSVDGRLEYPALHSYSGDPRTLPPPSFSSVSVESNLVTSYNDPGEQITQLQEEIARLQRQTRLLSTEKAKTEDELKHARAEIVRLRARNELLERKRAGVAEGSAA